jgi:hypothetical protein
MTRYKVEWFDQAQDDFTELWLAYPAGKRSALTNAANQFDREMATDALLKGNPISQEGLWAYEASPLRFIYSVNEKDRLVEVEGIKECLS